MDIKNLNIKTTKNISSDSILIVAIIIVNFISMYTTYRGIYLIWYSSNESPMATYFVSIGLAVALGLAMISLTLKIKDSPKILKYCIAYITVALMSMLFNFNSLYSVMSSKYLQKNECMNLQALLTKVTSESKAFISKYYNLEKIEYQLNQAKSLMEFERDRPDEPGKGPRYTKYFQQFKKLEYNLKSKNKLYDNAVKWLADIEQEFSTITNDSDYYKLFHSSEKLKSIIKTVIDKMKGKYNYTINLNNETLKSLQSVGEKTDLWYSFYTIIDEIKNALNGQWRSPAFMKFLLAAFFSIMIDMFMFIVVLFSRKQFPKNSDYTKTIKKKKNVLWEDNFYDRNTIFMYGDVGSGKSTISAIIGLYFMEKPKTIVHINDQNEDGTKYYYNKWITSLRRKEFPEKTLTDIDVDIDLAIEDQRRVEKIGISFFEVSGEKTRNIIKNIINDEQNDLPEIILDRLKEAKIILIIVPAIQDENEINYYRNDVHLLISYLIRNKINNTPIAFILSKWDKLESQNISFKDYITINYGEVLKKLNSHDLINNTELFPFSVGKVDPNLPGKILSYDYSKGTSKIAEWILKMRRREIR